MDASVDRTLKKGVYCLHILIYRPLQNVYLHSLQIKDLLSVVPTLCSVYYQPSFILSHFLCFLFGGMTM